MADFQHALILRGPQGSSLAEIYYRAGSFIGDEPGIWVGALLKARLALLHKAWLLQRVVVHQLSGTKQTFQGNINGVGTLAVAGLSGGPSNAAVCQFYGASGGRRKMWMRGISADTISIGPDGIGVQVHPVFAGAFTAYVKQLVANGFGIRWLTQLPADGSGRWKVLKVDGSIVPGKAIVTLDRAHGLTVPPTGARVIFGGLSKKDLPGMNGHYQVLGANSAGPPATSDRQLFVAYATPQNAVVVVSAGSMRVESYQPISIFNPDHCTVSYPGDHTTRAGFTGSRGAQRAARIRQSP